MRAMAGTISGGLLFSASDLLNFLGCTHATWLDLRAVKGGPQPSGQEDAYTKLLQEKGLEHEKDYLWRLGESGLSIEEIASSGALDDRVTATRAAMRRGADIIYQGALTTVPWHGYSDFLRRVDLPSTLGAWSYEVGDTKLARTAKPKHAIQLGVYAELLRHEQGLRPRKVHVLLGDCAEVTLNTDDFVHYMGVAVARFEKFVNAPPARSVPEPCAHCQYCRWASTCEAEWAAGDHLGLVANMRSTQARRLRDAGITTMAALADHKGGSIAGMAGAVFARLCSQAALQVAKRRDGADRHEVLPVEPARGFNRLPTPDAGDIFFDMEGDPLVPGGLEYLFGFITGPVGKPTFTPFWAHGREEEKAAFQAAVDFIVTQLRKHPNAHIYHYASYEASALKRLSTFHGTREAEIDELLRNRKLVDLYRVVAEGLRVSEPRYSIKNMETFYMAKRGGDVKTAGDSVVVYERWRRLQDAALLDEIADYNKVDCISTALLRDWLISIRPQQAIWFTAAQVDQEKQEKAEDRRKAEARIEQMRQRLLASGEPGAETLADLLEFHRREDKPDFWAMFDRQYRPEEDLIDDADCLGGLRRHPTRAPTVEKQSLIHYFQFPAQDFKIREDDKPLLSETLDPAGEVYSIDEKERIIALKRGKNREALPERFSLLPQKPIEAKRLKDALFRVAEAVCANSDRYRAARDLLGKSPPRLREGKLLTDLQGDPLARAIDAVSGLDDSYLLIQGPPGAGKTYTSAQAIVSLLAAGKRVGVASNSHKAINNLLKEVEKVAKQGNVRFRGIKKSSKESQFLGGTLIGDALDNADVVGHQLIAGTAWLFSDERLDDHLDYLFIDEAGQVSLANVVAMSTSASNLVLVGDQMQLGQPIKGAHPGESGMSVLEYALRDQATVPPELGIFLPTSRRMHPDVCGFISAAFYDGRLEPAPGNESQKLVLAKSAHPALKATGLSFVEMSHTGCAQRSDEEAAKVKQIVSSLLSQRWVDRDGKESNLTLGDVLVVTPYNMQVATLEAALPAGACIGTVDKFQGQEAPVVIVSMTTSSAEEMPRDHEFLFSRNRLNVAISRAQALTIIIANGRLLEVPCRTIEQMKLVNALCWARAYADEQAAKKLAAAA